MVRISASYDGNLHTTAIHEPSGAAISTDAPVDNEGLGEAFSPTDLLAAAVLTCKLTIIGIVARRHGWDLEGTRGSVEKTMQTEGERRVGAMRVIIEMPASVPEDARGALETASAACPVDRSLRSEVEVSVTFRYR